MWLVARHDRRDDLRSSIRVLGVDDILSLGGAHILAGLKLLHRTLSHRNTALLPVSPGQAAEDLLGLETLTAQVSGLRRWLSPMDSSR
ncbi:hypothetical protein RRG08_048176 [Elysia crispata]|uniref:Uncharacterized protein n=1 Tax=Elysia crispata TaxID=231223 RepID=A0AAE0ZU96_9GAST|nr:hypothetical protein RRG08_048176 [Elysia crispata]